MRRPRAGCTSSSTRRCPPRSPSAPGRRCSSAAPRTPRWRRSARWSCSSTASRSRCSPTACRGSTPCARCIPGWTRTPRGRWSGIRRRSTIRCSRAIAAASGASRGWRRGPERGRARSACGHGWRTAGAPPRRSREPAVAAPVAAVELPEPAPSVAICMATFDPPAALLERQIESIRAQSHRDWVCIISDDASDPGRFAALEAMVARRPALRGLALAAAARLLPELRAGARARARRRAPRRAGGSGRRLARGQARRAAGGARRRAPGLQRRARDRPRRQRPVRDLLGTAPQQPRRISARCSSPTR